MEAKFSMPFCMAVLVSDRKAGLAQFTDEKVWDPTIRELMRKVKLYVDPDIESLGYDRMRTKVQVKLKNGTTLGGTGDLTRGHPENPMTDQELAEKFRDCANKALAESRIKHSIQVLLHLEELRDVRGAISLLTP